MACFLAPMAAAVIISIIRKRASTFAEKLKVWILDALLWGGAILLAVEHAWHGEIVPWPPFLTAMADPASTAVMLHEILMIGVPMTASIFAAWGLILGLSKVLVAKPPEMKLTTAAQRPPVK